MNIYLSWLKFQTISIHEWNIESISKRLCMSKASIGPGHYWVFYIHINPKRHWSQVLIHILSRMHQLCIGFRFLIPIDFRVGFGCSSGLDWLWFSNEFWSSFMKNKYNYLSNLTMNINRNLSLKLPSNTCKHSHHETPSRMEYKYFCYISIWVIKKVLD